jgi:hypothetical protein
MCRELPFSDYCGFVKPNTEIGAEFWQVKSEHSIVKARNTDKIPCIPIENTEKENNWTAGDVACSGENVWTCRDVAGSDWCNYHVPGGKYSMLVWKLESGKAHPVKYEDDGTFSDL